MLPVNRVDNGRTVVALRYEQRYNVIVRIRNVSYTVQNRSTTGKRFREPKLTVSSETEGAAMRAARNTLQSRWLGLLVPFFEETEYIQPFGQRVDRQNNLPLSLKSAC